MNQRVIYWTVNNVATMRSLLESGADGIITDEVAAAVRRLFTLFCPLSSWPWQPRDSQPRLSHPSSQVELYRELGYKP